MTSRKNWYTMVRHYRLMLVYIAAVTTAGFVLQVLHWKATS